MTKKEAAVIEVYTGVVMLIGSDRKYVYQYIEKLLGKPISIYTHKYPFYQETLKELSKPDFIDICRNLEEA